MRRHRPLCGRCALPAVTLTIVGGEGLCASCAAHRDVKPENAPPARQEVAMPNTANRDHRDTTASAAWPPDADVVTFLVTAAYIQRGDTVTATIDDEHRLRRMIRRLNRGARP